MNPKDKLKGQIISLDFIVGVIIFLVLFGMLLTTFASISDYSAYNEQRREMEMATSAILEIFAKTQGYPLNWEESPSNATSIGLASSDRILDNRKLNAFLSMDYNTARNKIGGAYDFQFRLANNGSSFGQEPSGSMVVYSSRIVLHGNSAEKMEIRIWRHS